ncbi:maleylpyruvate isomerase family mycothiol-dependent enzyme [Streptomyces sp. NPDC089919]|uniref:maleylpyruvate isomerase family mycothiol-dependent enzyme n=1 Tax=Streptomyces sp. NPDC089919 TaxID=3155188 RepID=UPI0034271F44
MEIAEHIKYLELNGRSLADAAERAGTDAPVPVCPGWQVADLLKHTGAVHRWAARIVGEPVRERAAQEPAPELSGAELIGWFREGHAALVETLAAAPADLDCWTFVPGVAPLGFWARRQAHETAVHRLDAESALGGAFSPVGAEFAADGVDELLSVFHVQAWSRLRVPQDGPVRVLRVRATDTGAVWTARISTEPLSVERTEDGPADCELTAPAEWLYAALWNRRPLEGSAVSGDASVARLWVEKSRI